MWGVDEERVAIRMRPRVMSLFVLALVVVAFAGGVAVAATVPAPPYEANTECLECHDVALTGAALSKVEFADSVDLSACSKCHWVTPGAPYVFDHDKVLGAPDCRSCHYYMSTARPWAGQVVTPYGNFATVESPGLSASTIHAAHVNGSWPGSSRDCDEYCRSCHGPSGCSMCHTASLAEGGHGLHVAAADPLLPEYAPIAYMTAGGSARASTVVSEVNYALTTVTCAASGCHPRDSLAVSPVPTCLSCHDSKAADHGYTAIDHVAADSTEGGIACSACHTLDLATAHGDAGAAGASCTTCHPVPRDSFAAWDQSCATGNCHTATSTAPMHAAADASHAVAESNALCLDCHTGTDLGSIHVGATDVDSGTSSCLVCHTGASGEPSTNDCTVCHFSFADHYPADAHASTPVSSGCTKCHSMDLKTEHDKFAVDCMDCHTGTVAVVVGSWDGTCDACHPYRHKDRKSRW